MRPILTLITTLGLAACYGDETVAKYGGAATDWQLLEIDGKAYTASATLSFAEAGKISGQAPCNRYFAGQTAPYPWFQADQIGSTRRTCPDQAAETDFLQALADMTLSEVAGNTLILSNEGGREMVFKAVE